jgi:hypothetical protein
MWAPPALRGGPTPSARARSFWVRKFRARFLASVAKERAQIVWSSTAVRSAGSATLRDGHRAWAGRTAPSTAPRTDGQSSTPPRLITVPTRSPAMIETSAPGADMSNTTIGRSLSRQNAMAVESITLRSWFITSM